MLEKLLSSCGVPDATGATVGHFLRSLVQVDHSAMQVLPSCVMNLAKSLRPKWSSAGTRGIARKCSKEWAGLLRRAWRYELQAIGLDASGEGPLKPACVC